MTMRCSMCCAEHNRYRDRNHQRPASYCAECHAKYMRETRPKYSQLTAEQKRKANARAYANVYQRRGIIKRAECIVFGCGTTAEKHHEDYSLPLQISWMCRAHHLAVHAGHLRQSIDNATISHAQ